jgi:hypothetical protein
VESLILESHQVKSRGIGRVGQAFELGGAAFGFRFLRVFCIPDDSAAQRVGLSTRLTLTSRNDSDGGHVCREADLFKNSRLKH